MFEKVLLPTDFSTYANRTVECIGQIPSVREVILLHVLDASRSSAKIWLSGRTLESLDEHARLLLQEQKEYLESLGLTVKVVLEAAASGDIRKVILRTADTEQVPLIAMGARGKGIITGFLLGSVSAGVLRFSKTNVLITQYKSAEPMTPEESEKYCRRIFSKVLCPVDFSRPSKDMLMFVKDLNRVSEVILVHVVKSAETKEDLERAVRAAESGLREMKGILENELLTVKTFVRFGSPSIAISDLAEEEDVSLIMMPRFGERDYFRDIPIGSTTVDVAKIARRPLFVRYPRLDMVVDVRELAPEEFPLAEELWLGYHQQKADLQSDRIFGVFLENHPVSVARCKRHPDGLEVDGVFTPEEFRGRGFARKAVEALIAGCGNETLYMHSTLELVSFYETFGFKKIRERDMPRSIRSRFGFALGEMKGANVQPMKRAPE
ncbi:MAG: GNAT family N-acetyltransferase [Methanomicrobiaceae archaeon]|uniref:Universal stress protein n=1 Tax=hydrocarbon metagenome TaxID=938273 RepID=A0A0W8FIE7_9ZZZZ|nr:GNAT family N-acetyltransferase [Methanomicrobiaceae archaeon]MDD5420053.1 GNAT family N-acetyltransferase [Methanomicrobiaceae archaeon]